MADTTDTIRRWREAEERLYPVVTLRPDLYQVAVGAVRAVADHLGPVPDADALVTTYHTTSTVEDLGAAGIDADALPPEVEAGTVRDAAYQLRRRELEMRAASEQAERAIERARRDGTPTAVVWSGGTNELWPPYRHIEMSIATGFAVAAATELNPETLAPLYVLEGIQLDPDTGVGLDERKLVERQEFHDPEAWRTARAELRQTLLQR